MKNWIIAYLRRLLAWLDPPIPSPLDPPVPGSDGITIFTPRDDLLSRVKILVQEQEPFDASGEYKRHQVYAQLLKEYPYRHKRDLAYLIEVVLQEK